MDGRWYKIVVGSGCQILKAPASWTADKFSLTGTLVTSNTLLLLTTFSLDTNRNFDQ